MTFKIQLKTDEIKARGAGKASLTEQIQLKTDEIKARGSEKAQRTLVREHFSATSNADIDRFQLNLSGAKKAITCIT